MPQPPAFSLDVAAAARYFHLRRWQPRLALKVATEPLPQRVRRLHLAWAQSRLSDGKSLARSTMSILEAALHHSRNRVPTEALTDVLLEIGVELGIQNDIVLNFPEVDLSRSLTAAEAQHVTERLTELQTRIEHDDRVFGLFSQQLCSLLAGLLDVLPDAAFSEEPAPFMVPLHPLLDPYEMASRFIVTFLQHFAPGTPDPIAALPFACTRAKLFENLLSVSGLTFEQYETAPHRIVVPKDCGLAPEQMIQAYLGGTPLVALAEMPVPFAIPRRTLAEHGAIFAPTGHGKTQLLQTLAHSFLQEDDPPGMFVIDSQGDEKGILRKIERLDLFHPEHGRLRDRLVILDPEDVVPPALNFFELGKSRGGYDAQLNDLFQYLFTAIDSDLTAKQGTAVTYLLRLMAKIPNATIDTLKNVMEENVRSLEQSRYWPYIEELDTTTQDFFRGQFFGGQMKDTRPQVARRLYTLLANPLFSRMFSAPENRFDADAALRDRKIVLINTSQRVLGEDSSAVLGRFFVAQIFAAAIRRGTQAERSLSLLLIDEAQEYLDAKTEKLLDQARKFGLGLVMATQRMEKIEPTVKAAIVGNAALKMAGPVAHSDAQSIAHEINCKSDFIRSMRKVDGQFSEFATYVRKITPGAIRIRIPFLTLEHAPRMDDAAYDRMRNANRARVGLTEGAVREPERKPKAGQQQSAPDGAVPENAAAPLRSSKLEDGKPW